MLLSLSIAGITFVGADIAGFFNNPPAELQVDGYQYNLYCQSLNHLIMLLLVFYYSV